MEIIAAFVAGALLGAGSLITWALCAANTMYEEKLKKVKTNEDMLKLADSEQLRKALKRMCWKTTMYLSPLLREAQEKRIDEAVKGLNDKKGIIIGIASLMFTGKGGSCSNTRYPLTIKYRIPPISWRIKS